jgi:hypothetical protein
VAGGHGGEEGISQSGFPEARRAMTNCGRSVVNASCCVGGVASVFGSRPGGWSGPSRSRGWSVTQCKGRC